MHFLEETSFHDKTHQLGCHLVGCIQYMRSYLYVCLRDCFKSEYIFVFTEVRAVLLTDVLILMERNEDKDKFKYHLRCHTNLDAVKEKAEVRGSHFV